MVFSGDGGFQMSAQCLSTQTRFNLNPIIFVIANGIYGVEQWLADASVFNNPKPFYKSCILTLGVQQAGRCLRLPWMESQHI